MKKNIMTLKIILLLTIVSFTLKVSAGTDLSQNFKQIYEQQLDLSIEEQKRLNDFDIYFIPGILAESFIGSDPDSSIDVSKLTKDYFGDQLDFLNKKYNIPAKRIKTSSHDISITRSNIRAAILNAKSNGRKVILLSHSLGGLALLEELIENPRIQNDIGGIVFLQSPFYGTPIGDVLLSLPYPIEKLIRKSLPFVNISDETLYQVGNEARKFYMIRNFFAIRKLIKNIPSYTFAGYAEGNKSIFKPLIDLMESGCFKNLHDKCVTKKYYFGPYDKSDGVIPLKSTRLDNADFVILEKADHGEIILRVPFEDYSKEHLTTTWLRVLLQKMKL